MPGFDTPPPPPTGKEFCYDLDGLTIRVKLSVNADGAVQAKICVDEGAADINALYWGDDDQTGPSAGLRGPLNMNGTDTQWDGALRLSDPGLGRLGADRPTYLTAGEHLVFSFPPGVTPDDIDTLGIRATSTTTPGGSIKAETVCIKDDEPPVDDPKDPPAEDPKDPPEDDPDVTPAWQQAISNVVLYYDTDGDGQPDYSVKVDEFDEDAPRDLDRILSGLDGYARSEADDLPEDAVLVGVSIKGGTQPTQYFRVEGNENGPEADPDDAPEALTNTGPGNADELFHKDFVDAFGTGDEDAPMPEDDEPEEALVW